MEIVPESRGLGLGKLILKNIVERFYDSSGLIVLKAFPLQHELNQNRDLPDWTKKMKLHELEQR